VSNTHSFRALWKPPFISKVVSEDRCHLNGIAMENGQPRYVTTVSTSDEKEGWRKQQTDGGTVIDVTTNEIVVAGLSMPHSPRIYQGKLWLLNSGTGYFGYCDLEKGEFVPMTFCPGFLRGLDFYENYAILGLSKTRRSEVFEACPLNHILKEKNIEPFCGLHVIDLNTGEILHTFSIEKGIDELYDVKLMPGVINPRIVSLEDDEIDLYLNPDCRGIMKNL